MIPEKPFELCSGQKLSTKINKGQKLQKYDGQSYGTCALHFSLMRSIHLCSFKMIPETLFELCSRQKCGLRTDQRTERQTDQQVQSNIPPLLPVGA